MSAILTTQIYQKLDKIGPNNSILFLHQLLPQRKM